jgi:hypothetical protein
MATIAGLRGTGDWGTDERPKNFRETILWLDPNGQAPLQALMSKMGSESTDDPEFAWWEEKLQHNRIELDAQSLAASTTLSMASGAFNFVKGDLLIVESAGGIWANEIVKVTADPTADTALTVQRGFAGTTATDIASGAFLTAIGTSFAEGSLAPKSSTRNPTKLKNYCQIFKKSYEITNTADVTKARTGNALTNDKKRRMFDYYRDMEMSMIYGKASETVGDNGKPERTMGGLLSFITTNRTQFGGGGTTLNEDNLIDFFAQVFNFDGQGAGNQRLAFVGNMALTAINKLARNSASTRINFDKTATPVYGMNFTRWVLPQGEIFFKTHPLFNIHPELTKAMMVINPKGIKERVLRATKPEMDIQAVGQDSKKGQWIGEIGLEVNHEETMAFAGGIA